MTTELSDKLEKIREEEIKWVKAQLGDEAAKMFEAGFNRCWVEVLGHAIKEYNYGHADLPKV